MNKVSTRPAGSALLFAVRSALGVRRTARVVSTVVLLALSWSLAAQPSEDVQDERDDGSVIRGRIDGKPGHRSVIETRVLVRGAGRPAWTQQGDEIAFDRPNSDGFYDVYRTDDGGDYEICVTCDNYEFYKQHVLSPAYHPSGEMLVVQVQDLAKKLEQDTATLATVLRGVHSELWAVSKTGRGAWRLTKVRDNGGAVIEPVFDFEGGQLMWSERETTRYGRWGNWQAHVAKFSFRRGTPRLGKTQRYRAGERSGLLIAESFSPDQRSLLLSAGASATVPDDGLDVVLLDRESGAMTSLTRTPEAYDGTARYAPTGEHIAWASARGIAPSGRPRLPRQSDLWLMRTDGSEQERLTFFNDPDGDPYLGESLIADLAWAPSGDRLAVHVISAGGPDVEQAIWIVVLDDSFRR